ncbi:MAG: hypothetical protein DWQ04_01600 [Chloroflexi bacterium]|nr:MAG: hypothetical protein DWQ04_01600 [Chloroflexota bacterium]
MTRLLITPHNESWGAAPTNSQVLIRYLSTNLHGTYAYDFAEEVIAPTDTSWKKGRDENRPWTWFNIKIDHPQWLKDRMNIWDESNFYYLIREKGIGSFAVLTPNQQAALCGTSGPPSNYPNSCASMPSDAAKPN